jgi:hypothetical protein
MGDIILLLCASNKNILTTRKIITKYPECLFATLLQESEGKEESQNEIIKLNCLERDAALIRHIINALRHPQEKFLLPDDFSNYDLLIEEIRYWHLDNLEKQIATLISTNATPSSILIAYHGTLTFGKQGFSTDVNFRKIHRILVSVKMSDCRQVFGDTLNQGRDGDMGEDRYTSRVYLKHTFLEQAFDYLAANGYSLITASSHTPAPNAFTQHKDEQECYMHYSQFTFQKS